MAKIVWNGRDGYILADTAAAEGHNFDGNILHHDGKSFAAFEAEEITPEEAEAALLRGDGIYCVAGNRHFV